MLTSESILKHHTLDLKRYGVPIPSPGSSPFHVSPNSPYQLMAIDGRVIYAYPHGTSLLSVPFVALMNVCGLSARNPDGNFSLDGEAQIQRLIAALLMASLVF